MAQKSDRKLDAVEFLEAQHEEVRALFSQLNSGAKGKEREETFQCLVRMLAVHETAEEVLVHPEVKRTETGDAIAEIRKGEESQAKEMLAELEKMGVDHPEFDAKLATFEDAVMRHADAEEEEEFPLLYEVHDENVLERMTVELKAVEAMAPTHPHPHGPDGPIGNLVIGPFVGMVDRVRDFIQKKK